MAHPPHRGFTMILRPLGALRVPYLGHAHQYGWDFQEEIPEIVGVLRGNTIRGNRTRNFERKMAL